MAFLSAKEAKLYGLIVAGVTLLALLGTLIVMLLTRNPEPAPRQNRGSAESPAGAELLGESQSAESVVQKIRIPAEYTQLYNQEWFPFREVHESWSREQIETFWKDPSKLVEEVLQTQSDREVEEFFEEIP